MQKQSEAKIGVYIERVVSSLENVCAIVAGISLLVAILLVSANALSRHLFSAPLEIQLELTESYLLVMLIALALPWSFRKGGFIRITIFAEVFNQTVWNAAYQIGLIASALYMAILGYEAFDVFLDAWQKNYLIMGVIDWPVAWSWVWIPIGCWLLAARALLMAFGFGDEPQGH
jgi:TRAP-type C4-dicarboxylate transport system permease small subunit